jgi:hypothetical protein
MKEFFLNTSYRGRWFDVRFCAKSKKEAAKIMDISIYQITNYGGCKNIDQPYKEIYAKPYCYHARELLGRNELLFDDAKKRIDIEAEKFMSKLRK